MTKKRKILIITTILLLITGLAAYFYVHRGRSCQYIACASGDDCVAPNDAIVECEDLRNNPTNTIWP